MARPKQFDRDDVLERAVQTFAEGGFDVSVPRLVDELGICRQSLYDTFGDKRGLFLAALERYGEREVDAKLELLAAPGSALENLRTVIRSWAELALRCPGPGCLTATAMVEAREDDAIRAAVERQIERLEGGFFAALESARKAGELRKRCDPRRLAETLTTTAYGIGVVSRLPGSRGRIAATVSTLLGLIDAHAV